MAAGQGSNHVESSLSVFVAPRSTTTWNSLFSSSAARSGAPIKRMMGGVEEYSTYLLQERNPALPRSDLRHIVDSTSNEVDNTLFSKSNVLCPVREEEFSNTTSQLNWKDTSTWSVFLKTPYPSVEASTFCQNKLDDESAAKWYNAGSKLSVSTYRSLTSSTSVDMSITNTGPSAPGSPPELTESQSSKSSFYESHFSSPDEFAGGNMNFEEITLDDEASVRANETKSRVAFKNGHPRTAPRKRPALATLQTQNTSYLRSTENGVKSAVMPHTKRNFTSPVISAVSAKYAGRTRPELPALHKPKSASGITTFSQSATSLGVPGRRGSWQPTRKTIYEIEAEYHDSDDELPDDASLFNVPMSPFGSYSRSAPRSARSSAQGSPERDSPAISPRPIPLDHARPAAKAPVQYRSSSKTLSRQRSIPRASSNESNQQPRAASTSPRNDMHYTRTRSWHSVMTDLNREARIISEKLDFHHGTASNPTAATVASHRSSAPSAIPLPPIQRSTLDFMPTSREKEAVLSRTRPSWLPPKDSKEEKRHLEEYKRMMKASIEADKKREERVEASQNVTESTVDSLHRIWTFYVDPTTDLTQTDRRVNALCWRGIPPKMRGSVWQRTVGNSLGLTKHSYTMAVGRVKEVKSKPIEKLLDNEKALQERYSDIERDAETAFPDLCMFRRNGPQWQDLIDVCEAYSSYRSDIGYTYGTQLVAALILLQVPEPAEAFILLANCLNKTMPQAFRTNDVAAISRTYGKVKATLDIKFPRLHAYLFDDQEHNGLGFSGEELLEPMFQTLFANGLNLDQLCRVWDIWLFESDRYLVRTAVALLGALQSQIFDLQGDIDLRRRNIQEMLGWGPFNRDHSGYWKLDTLREGDAFVEQIRAAGRLNTVGR